MIFGVLFMRALYTGWRWPMYCGILNNSSALEAIGGSQREGAMRKVSLRDRELFLNTKKLQHEEISNPLITVLEENEG